jgi:hypothetical protein
VAQRTCGKEEYTGEETAAYFLFGCPSSECLREAFIRRTSEYVERAVKAAKFRKFEVAVKSRVG